MIDILMTISSIPGKIADFFHAIPLFPLWLQWCIYAWLILGAVTIVTSSVWYVLPVSSANRVQAISRDYYSPSQALDVRGKSFDELKKTVNELQYKALDFMHLGDYEQAKEMLTQAEPYLNEAILRNPLDTYVLNLRGYMFKDWAQINFHFGERSEGEKLLDKAKQVFNYILKVNDKDAGAHNGLGSVYTIRGKYELAEKEILRALEILPDYKAAQYDLEQVQKLIEEEKQLSK